MCGCRKSGKWSNIRQLTWCRIVDGDDLEDHIFVYGADGIRCRKDNIYYTRDGDRVLRETNGLVTLTYYYGTNGIVGFHYVNLSKNSAGIGIKIELFGYVFEFGVAINFLSSEYKFGIYSDKDKFNYNNSLPGPLGPEWYVSIERINS